MKKLNLFFVFCILFSCSQKNPDGPACEWVGPIDTLMVDGLGEILYLEDLVYALSPDQRYLYNFNKYDHTLEKIDLEELRLVEKLPFEKEGPHGTGNEVYYMNMVSDNHIHMANFWTSSQFDLGGTRMASHSLAHEGFKGMTLSEDEQWKNSVVVPGQPDILFALASDRKDGGVNLRRIDIKQKLLGKYEFDKEEKLPRFSFRVPALSPEPIVRPQLYLSVENGQVIVSTDISSEIHWYDDTGDSLVTIKNNHWLSTNEKKVEFSAVYGSVEELMVDYQKVLEATSFSPPVWDSENERYYRFSFRVEFGQEKEPGALLPTNIGTHVYLSVYDENFGLVAESAIPLLANPRRYFARGGDIWILSNIDDEMAFIRVNLKKDVLDLLQKN